ncbi:MAG: (2Fe-2S)-binding protein, partial [Clostridia bacterium]
RRKKQVVTNSLSKKQLNKLVKKDPLYGKIVCKCELVTEGEIRDAFLCPVPPKTIDGLKRRTRCGMGRCQGGFCMLKVATLIAKQNNIELKSVLKENKGSEIMPYEIKELEQEDDDNAKN